MKSKTTYDIYAAEAEEYGEGDYCPVCDAFNPAFTGECEHHITTVASEFCITESAEWLVPLHDAYQELIDFLGDFSRTPSFGVLQWTFSKKSPLAKHILDCAKREASLTELIDHLGYEAGGGWSSDGFINSSGWNLYHSDFAGSVKRQEEAEHLCKAFIIEASCAVLAKRIAPQTDAIH